MSFIRRSRARTDLPTAPPRHPETGFSLVELMVVVMIIAILLAIAIPAFLSARTRAQDRVAQADLRNALTAEKTYFTDKEVFLDTAGAPNIATLKGVEASTKWATTAVTTAPSLSAVVGDAMSAGDAGAVCLSAFSKNGTLWSIATVAAGGSAGTYYGKGACPATPSGSNIASTLGTNTW